MLDRMLIRHEANRLKPYLDCCGKPWRECTCEKKGKLTIGVGRNLDDVGIFPDESYFMLEHDKQRAIAQCRQNFPWFDQLNDVRKLVIVDMCYNLGIGKLLGFHNMIAAMEKKDYRLAARCGLDSLWAKQVGSRAIEDMHILETGEYAEGVA